MKDRITLRLKGANPEQLSLKKLSEYLVVFADMIGGGDELHLKSVTKGSACLNIEPSTTEAYNQAVMTIKSLYDSDRLSQRVLSAYNKMEDAANRDKYIPEIYINKEKVFSFPQKQKKDNVINLSKATSIQGVLYNIGGKDETIPVRIADSSGNTIFATTNKKLAGELASHLFETVRLSGEGYWERTEDKGWELKRLKVESYQILQDMSIRNAINALKEIGGNRWNEEEDPYLTLQKMRDGS